MANANLNTTFNGLQEFDYGVPENGNYSVQGKIQLPRLLVPTAAQGAGGGAGTGTAVASAIPSQVLTVIKLNSTTKYTGTAGDQGFATVISGAVAGDTIKVILSSSLAQDQQPEAVQCTVSIFEN